MDLMTAGLYLIGALIAFSLIKFLIKLPFYIMTFAILGALGYVAYTYVWPMLEPMLHDIM